MSAVKRKNGPSNESFARSRISSASVGPPAKRLRKEEYLDHTHTHRITESPQVIKVARTKGEEDAFPRGGASVLTPLEHKQIHIEATNDVLFERHSAPRESEIQIEEPTDKTVSRKTAERKKNIAIRHEVNKTQVTEDELVKIESLSYKRLVPGSLVLGQVYEINTQDIAISLPNNLTGYVPITSISYTLTKKIEKILSLESKNGLNLQQEEGEEGEEDIELKNLFYAGQYLRASVVSTSHELLKDASEKGKRRIELSIRPQEANFGITRKELIPYSTVMASVISVEDHGLVMDIGLLESGVRGFMSSKEIDHNARLSTIEEGSVFLCMITGLSPNGKIIKLSADTRKIANIKKSNYLVDGPTIDVFLPGTAVELLITDVKAKGIIGKAMGMIDATSDLIHSGGISGGKDLEKKYKIGTKVIGRIIWTFPVADSRKLGVSFLDHVMSLKCPSVIKDGQSWSPLDVLPLSTIIEEVVVRRAETNIGLFVDAGIKNIPGFVHISRVTDGKVDMLLQSTGPYQQGSKHRGRVIGYNAMDCLYLISFEQKVLDQAFLRVEDLNIGELVKGRVEKLVVNSGGVGGVLVTLSDGITGLVPEMHMADSSLVHPEKRFKEGVNVTARVLSTDPSKRKIRLTLKKSLVNSEAPPVKSYADIRQGMQSPGTIVNINSLGAVVQFYGNVRGFLPVSEMSESYIQDPNEHFRIGQVVNVHMLKIDADSEKLIVSCKMPSTFGEEQRNAFNNLKIGDLVSSIVTSKSNDEVAVELRRHGLQAILPVGHLTDDVGSRNVSALKKVRVGQSIENLMIIDKHEQKHAIILTNKPSLTKAAKNQSLPQDFNDLRIGMLIRGYVKNITVHGVFVGFGGSLTGLLPKSKLPDEVIHLQDFGFRKSQSVTARVHSLDQGQRRFVLSIRDLESSKVLENVEPELSLYGSKVSNPVDDTMESIDDLQIGKVITARIASIKETQINVQIADNIQGRIDVSQVFDSWDDIKDRKHPLKSFASKQVLPVRILGIHDARNHRFLPITHRSGKSPVFELSAKPSDLSENGKEVLTLDKIQIGSSWIAFVNNISDDCLWVNLSPNIRGRLRTLDISDDITLLKDFHTHFPIGSAIKVHVTAVDIASNKLDLSARTNPTTGLLSLNDLAQNMILPGKVTRVSDRHIMMQLSDTVSGPVNLPDLADDFAEADPTIYSKNNVISVCVVEVDKANKRIRLSTRPSRVLNSSLSVKDMEITSMSQLKSNDIVRGFIKNVADNGIFVNLGGTVTGYVRVSDLSDSYLKDWKASFQVDQLVKGKVILVDPILNHLQLSLKSSILDKDYVSPVTFSDLKVGQIVTGKIRKVEDFGVFIVIDKSANVSGLCHRTEMAEGRVENVKQLYGEGDAVRAKILKVEPEKRRISFGLKAAYFDRRNNSDEDSEGSEDVENSFQQIPLHSEDGDSNAGSIILDDSASLVGEFEARNNGSDQAAQDLLDRDKIKTLKPGGFDWTAATLDDAFDQADDALSNEAFDDARKKHRHKPTIKVDMTGELDAKGPQSASDFERLLLGQPNSSLLWIEYMAFQTKLGELPKARELAARALSTIDIREETEKLNIWIALLNLENEYGSNDTMEDTFRRACQFNDPQELHERLTSIYIQTGKHTKADEMFQVLVKKFSQSYTVWYNYAHFLHQIMSAPDRARLLLPRAIQALPAHTHFNVTLKFAALEFNSSNGSPERGRTIFEGLLSTFPKRLDIWNQLLDLEIRQGDQDIIRAIFERVTKVIGLKPRGAKAWFKRWSKWERDHGDRKSQEMVQVKAQEWVRVSVETSSTARDITE